jgi:fucose permease
MTQLALLLIIYLSFISLGLPDSLLGSAWPAMYTGLFVPVSYAGALSLIIAGGTIVSSLFSEKNIRRFGTGIVTAISVLMTAVALLGFSIANRFMALCIWAVPLGLGAGSVDAALNNYVALHYKAQHMNWLHCFWGIGATMGPMIMSFCLLNLGSWHSGYRTISIIQFGLVAILFFALPLWKRGAGKAAPPDAINKPSLKFRELLRLPGAKPALLAFFCYCSVEATAGLWGSSYLVIVKGIPSETAAKWIALYYFGITFGRLLSGFLTMKFKHRRMIRWGQVILAGGVVALLFPFGNGSLPGGFFLIGLGCAPIFPSLLHETPANFGSAHSQAIMGIQMACAYFGSTIMPPLFGMIASHLSYKLFPIYMGVLLIGMVMTVETLNKKVAIARQ